MVLVIIEYQETDGVWVQALKDSNAFFGDFVH